MSSDDDSHGEWIVDLSQDLPEASMGFRERVFSSPQHGLIGLLSGFCMHESGPDGNTPFLSLSSVSPRTSHYSTPYYSSIVHVWWDLSHRCAG